MLEKLDDVPWAQLNHAYGPATDVPEQIRNLAHPDANTRSEAMDELCGNIVHQGTRYEATPYAVPFLYELVEDRRVASRREIIALLVYIAIGYEELYLPDGVGPDTFRGELERARAKETTEEPSRREQYIAGLEAECDCYDAVRNGVSTLLHLFDDDDEQLRPFLIHALAWFPDYAAQSLGKLHRHLSVARDDADIANTLLSIGLLSHKTHVSMEAPSLDAWLEHPARAVRTAAAIALATGAVETPRR